MPINKDGPLEFRIGDVVRLRKPHPVAASTGKSTGSVRISGSNAMGCQRRSDASSPGAGAPNESLSCQELIQATGNQNVLIRKSVYSRTSG